MSKMFLGVSERLFSFAALSSVLKYSYSVPFHAFSCSYRETFSSYPTFSVSSLQLFEIPISLATLYAVASTGQNLLQSNLGSRT